MSAKILGRKPFSTRILGLILGPVLFLMSYFFIHPKGMSPEAHAVMATTLWVAIWWITEAIPIAATALLPIVLFPLTGALPIDDTTASFANPLIFLYLGGFIIAVAIEKWNLHKRIALTIINWIGSDWKLIVLGFMIATAFLSMWISNTATTVMMLPIGVAVVKQVTGDSMVRTDNELGKGLMLGIAYSASIGGIATLIGTPTNLVFSAVVEELYGMEISFADWIKFGLPISLIMLFICWWYLINIAFPVTLTTGIEGGRATIREALRKLGPVTSEERTVMIVFVTVALCWITRSFLLQRFIPNLNDTIIAIAGALVLFLIPAKSRPSERLINWETAEQIPWGILLLFGGGLTLAAGFKSTGLADWIGNQISLLEGVKLILLLGILIALVNFLTEITSNVATASMILPILAALALAIDVHPYGLMVAATLASSCAFMLPVATPPNAVVFGSGYLRIPDMMRAGIWLNLLSIVLVTLIVYFFLPWIWKLDLSSFPLELKQ